MKPKGTKKVFISYKSDDDRSVEIKDQLEEFFNNWGLECKPVDRIENIDPPKIIIDTELRTSHYLIQIFNRQEKPSPWMRKEWDEAQNFHKYGENMRMLAAFYTTETPIDNESFRRYVTDRNRGEKRIINIDKEKKNAETTIQGIVINAGVLNKTHGKIILPDFCYFPQDPSDISLEAFEDFIECFRDAYEKGLSKVYPDKDKPTAWIVKRLRSMKDGEKVRMLGFTLNRFIYPENKRGIGDVFEQVLSTHDCKAELLIFDRDCQAAHDRMKIETYGDYKKGPKYTLLYKDNENVEKYYSKKKWKDRITIKKYSTPYMGMVIFNDMILVEIYHLGDDGEEKTDKNICGRVPLLFIQGDTPFYKLFESHFERVWGIA